MTERIYKRRIAFVVAGVFLVPSGGIGHFTKAFLNMADELDWAVDLICDGPIAKNDFADEMIAQAGNVFLPDKGYSYASHQRTHAFAESWNLEKSANFRDALMKAFSKNVYDMVLVNTNEALLSVLALGIDKQVAVVNYSHNANVVFAKTNPTKAVHGYQYEQLLLQMMGMPGCTTATQTDRNKSELDSIGVTNSVSLPMPLSDMTFCRPNPIPWSARQGVLFIGRWENGKQPKEFIRLISETGLPAKVMTSAKGVKKFQDELDKIGAKHDVRGGIYGQEKVDFIQSSRVFYMPSMAESYGYAMLECMGQIPSVVLSEYPWWENFDPDWFTHVPKKDAVSQVKSIYENGLVERPVSSEYVANISEHIYDKWSHFLEKWLIDRKTVDSSAAAIAKKDDLFYHQHIDQLGRPAGIEDVISVLNHLTNFKVSYTKEHTWLTRQGTEVPVASTGALDDFF